LGVGWDVVDPVRMEFKVGKNKVGSEMALLFFHISNDNLQYLMLTDIEDK
jgi:hypothetical protein